jgi:UrcA family protein
MKRVTKTALLCAGLCGLAGAAVADPAYGPYGPYPAPQPYPAPVYAPAPYADGVTVYGRPAPYRVPDHVQELSAGVVYNDLDLATREGQDELNWRIARTADDLCDRLGEGDEAGRRSSVLPTCQASARDGARGQVRRAVKDAQYAAAYAPPAYPPYPPAGYGPPVYAPQAYAAPAYTSQAYTPPPVYSQPYAQPVYAQPQTAWTPPPCNCQTAWTPPRAGW